MMIDNQNRRNCSRNSNSKDMHVRVEEWYLTLRLGSVMSRIGSAAVISPNEAMDYSSRRALEMLDGYSRRSRGVRPTRSLRRKGEQAAQRRRPAQVLALDA